MDGKPGAGSHRIRRLRMPIRRLALALPTNRRH
jgi:hypothetical protein